jgi:hypothetical protein
MITKDITVKQLYDSIVLNGLTPVRGRWFNVDYYGVPTAGCILMQGAWNLKVVPTEEETMEINIPENYAPNTLIWQLNNLQLPVGSKWAKNVTNEERYYYEVGDAIIRWYDAKEYVNEGTLKYAKYLIPDDEVLPMVKEILEPHFDEILTLAVYDKVEIQKDLNLWNEIWNEIY